MSADYELFDANHIQRSVRHRMYRLNVLLCAILVITLAGLLLGRTGQLSSQSLAWMVVGGLFLGAGVAWHHRHLSRTVWCVKVSPEGLVGYDCARRKTHLPWSQVERVDVTDEALVIVQSPYQFVAISTSFFDYPSLSHGVLSHAEDHDIAFYLNGRSLADLDVYVLYPFLTDATSADPSGSAA